MANTQVRPKRYLSNDDLAERYEVSINTIRDWRRRGMGPRGHKFGGLVRYSIEDVEAWEHAARDDRAPAGAA